ncbi:MAG: glycoside hydrolase family 3 C-terminal domain-containing protein, partial [Anaerolineales bacterium]|nr:glycoside hydrolase family 3 C-terminal domain-containing protein [Anaerolineales bacterium]
DGVQVSYAIGCPIHRSLPPVDPAWLVTDDGQPAVTVAYYANTTLSGEPAHVQPTRKTDLSWFGDSAPYIDPNHFSLRMTGALRVPVSGRYVLSLGSVGLSRLIFDGETRIDQWENRSADVPYEETVEQQIEVELEAKRPYPFTVEFAAVQRTQSRLVRLGCIAALPADPIQEAVDLAAQADVAIVVAGLTPEWESEGFDRADMHLVGRQDELIARVAAANPRTIVVLNVGSPVAMPWLDAVPALLQLWYPGQESGNALADVLFGDVNPSGRLPVTFPRRLADNPAYVNYPGENGRVHYGEGLFVGYRYYDKKEIAPLFPFGFGLSYTRFRYANLEIAPQADQVIVSLDVTNAGARAGQEVVQLYVRHAAARLVRPLQELKAYAKVALAPGETRRVSLTLTPQSLAFYDPAQQAWVTEPGSYTLFVGGSSRDFRLQGELTWGETAVAAPAALHTGRGLGTLLGNDAARAVLVAHLGDELLSHPQLSLALGMSLRAVAGFVPAMLPAATLDAIDADLAQLAG